MAVDWARPRFFATRQSHCGLLSAPPQPPQPLREPFAPSPQLPLTGEPPLGLVQVREEEEEEEERLAALERAQGVEAR
eukprot:3024797-Prymnesium_polylepis.2